MINKMKAFLIVSISVIVSCNTSNKNEIDQHSVFSEFLCDFEGLLEQRYGQQYEKADLFRKFIQENNEAYPLLICLDNIDNLFKYFHVDSLWIPISQHNGDIIYFLNFDGWFCDFMDELAVAESWIEDYKDIVCSAKDISPTSIVLVLENAENMDLKNEKIRFFIAVHFFSLMVDKGCIDYDILIPHTERKLNFRSQTSLNLKFNNTKYRRASN